MKQLIPVFLACVLTIPAFAQEAKTNTSPNVAATPVTHEVGQTFPVSAGVVSSPFVLTNGCISQPAQTEVAGGGKAVFNFVITNAGNYVIHTMVYAPDESANSFYVNVDAQPEDPKMIWDIEVTTGFQQRTVSWRGNGSPEADEFVPKKFTLAPGAHKLIIVGREAEALLQTLSIRSADK